MTRAVLLTSSGAVHRVVIGPDGADKTACDQTYHRHAQVSPVQALVYPLVACDLFDCWPQGRWQHFVEGSLA